MKRSRIIALTLVVAMIMMGTAYAAWTQTIEATATVSTGKLEVQVSKLHASQMGKIGNEESKDGKDFQARGDVQKKYPEVSIGDLAVGSFDMDQFDNMSKIVATGVNFFPQTSYDLIFDVENTGTIPADIDFTSIDTVENPFDMPTEDVIYKFAVVDYGLTGWDKYVITEEGSDLKAIIDGLGGYTLEEGDKVKVRVRAQFTDDADEESLKEDYNYSFGFEVNVSQFNID